MTHLFLISMRSIAALVICAFLLTGCSSLIIHNDDNVAVVATKVTVRTVNCALTIFMGCASEWIWMEDAKAQSMVWVGRGDINGDNYKCQQEASSNSSGATGYVYMPIGKNAMLLPMNSGGREINQQLYHSCMRAHGYALVDQYEYDRWREKDANKSVSASQGSLCAPSNAIKGTRLRRSSDGKMVKITALYANSPRCSDPATPTPVDVEEVGEGESSISASQGSLCAPSNATIGTRLKIPGGKMVKVKTLYGNSPRCSDPAIPILVDVEEVGEREASVSASQSKPVSARAQYDFGIKYANGHGVPQDYAKAREWYEQAAAQGFAMAQNNLGVLYQKGQGVPQDDAKAQDWYEQAAAQGFAMAQYNLGVLYQNGRGVIGMLFHFGQGFSRDYTKAREWYEQAAAQGFAMAQLNLGVMYQNGQGVPQDDVRAYMWYNLATPQLTGDNQKLVADNRDKAAHRMTPAQVEEAQRLSQQCQAQQFKGC